ncbi:alpha/beta hydrolase [uncultured Pseudodesulfovibrio sp.]|uniref:alpha/beta hydrolase n=1 Tax=uncultured Pseudodesulfovibrio sp. TaxID=2035858 RepID=UPI0029C82E1B|nr:alpha/beta hydrolase [uncultured Pseudodesulfovibrio sp.]
MQGWKKMTREETDREYNAVASVPDLSPYMEYDAEANARARRDLRPAEGVAYGASSDETVDIFPAHEPDAPVLFFIHGGYWKSMRSSDFHLIANGLVPKGVTVVLPNYSLCPAVSMDEITRQNRAALAWTHAHASGHNGSPDKLFVCGHSAGGQQAGMLASTDWTALGLPADAVKGVLPVSGLYDLAPLADSWLQPTLRLTEALIEEQSPLRNVPADGPPLYVSVGGEESSEFRRQAREYLAAWRERGNMGELFVQEDRNHFTSFRDFDRPDGELTVRVLGFMERCLG